MIGEENIKTLIKQSSPTLEIEEDDDKNLVEMSSNEYDNNNLLDSIGKENFKEVYSNCFIFIKQYKLEDKLELSRKIIQKVQEVYNFNFVNLIDCTSESDFDKLLQFLEWLEYDNVEFFTDLLINLNIDFKTKFVKEFFLNIWNKIEIFIFEKYKYNNYFQRKFLQENNKENIIDFCFKNMQKNKTLIIEEIIKKGEKL
jgi:hypothetical protein